MASFPQAPYDSPTRCIQHHPKALHLGSFSVCLRSSVDNAAARADNPATDTILGFSGDVTEISKASGLPRAQLDSKMSAGHEWSWSEVRLQPISAITLKWALWQVSTNTLHRWLYHVSSFLHVVAW